MYVYGFFFLKGEWSFWHKGNGEHKVSFHLIGTLDNKCTLIFVNFWVYSGLEKCLYFSLILFQIVMEFMFVLMDT